MASLWAHGKAHKSRSPAPVAPPTVAAPIAKNTPLVAELAAQASATAERQKRRFEGRRAARYPKGRDEPNIYRAAHARPPPHIAAKKPVELELWRKKSFAAARARGFGRGDSEVSGFPWWAWIVTARCAIDWQSEIRHLPRPVATRLFDAAMTGRTPDAQRAIATVGCVLTWLSLRHPKFCGQASNVGGIPGALIVLLTEREWAGEIGPYSLSALQHANHRGAGPGNPDAGTAGFLETLRQYGVLDSWVPPAQRVPDWMRGERYAFHVFRLPSVAWEPWTGRIAPS